MFETTTKHKPTLAGPAYLRAYLDEPLTQGVPHLAIGGIHAHNVGELVRVGCRGIAVSSVVCGASEPRVICEQLCEAIRGA
jgi:thiamine-phosphate pyrophosphorylase